MEKQEIKTPIHDENQDNLPIEKKDESPTPPPPLPPPEKWYQFITVEPTMFLYMLAFMLTSVVEKAFFLHKACLVNHGQPIEVCDNLDNNTSLKKDIQVTVSNFHQYNNIAGHVVPIILALFLGSWSDKRGRKLPLLCGLVGKLIYSVMVVVNATQTHWPLEYIIYTASIPGALTGADVAIFASCFAYISDVSNVKNRTLRVTILDACYLSTMPIGVALGSYLFNYVFNHSYVIMFSINASLLILSIIYTIFNLKWKTTPKHESITAVGCCGVLPDFFDWHHVLESARTMLKKRRMNRRAYLWILMISMLFYTFQRDEKPMTYLYTQFKFNWDVETYSNFKTFQSTAYIIFMLGGIPLMSKLLGFQDTTIAMVGASAHIIARIFFAAAQLPWVFYIGGAISGLGPVVGPIIRSMVSKVVPGIERGKVFALLSVCDNAVPFFSGVLYTQVYNATVNKIPGIFYLTIATQVIVFILMLVIHVTLKGRPLEVPEEIENLIAMIGCLAHILARLCWAIAETPTLFYIGGGISTIGPITSPLIKSMISKLVEAPERGKIFGIFSFFNNAGPFIGSIAYAKVYGATTGTPAIFWLTALTQLIVLLLLLMIHINGAVKPIDEQEKSEKFKSLLPKNVKMNRENEKICLN